MREFTNHDNIKDLSGQYPDIPIKAIEHIYACGYQQVRGAVSSEIIRELQNVTGNGSRMYNGLAVSEILIGISRILGK